MRPAHRRRVACSRSEPCTYLDYLCELFVSLATYITIGDGAYDFQGLVHLSLATFKVLFSGVDVNLGTLSPPHQP